MVERLCVCFCVFERVHVYACQRASVHGHAYMQMWPGDRCVTNLKRVVRNIGHQYGGGGAITGYKVPDGTEAGGQGTGLWWVSGLGATRPVMCPPSRAEKPDRQLGQEPPAANRDQGTIILSMWHPPPLVPSPREGKAASTPWPPMVPATRTYTSHHTPAAPLPSTCMGPTPQVTGPIYVVV